MKAYKTIIQYEIISENPIDVNDLSEIAYECKHGDWSGRFLDSTEIVLNGKEVADALIAQGSDPEFFGIDEI